MSDSPDFTLAPSPADPQPVRVYMLDDCTWWAGYSLQQCIREARYRWDPDIDPDQISRWREMDSADAQRIRFIDGDRLTFAAELQRRIDAGQTFPQLFAGTEG